MFSPSLFMAFSYGFTIMSLCHTPSKPLAKCKEEQPYGFLECSRSFQQKELKQLQVLYLSRFTYKNLGEDHSFAHHLYHLIISFKHLWTPLFVLPNIAIHLLSSLSQIGKKQKSRATLLILTIELMELFLHFLLFILNFLQVLELLTFFLIVFLLIIVMKKMKKNDKQCLYQLDSMVIESSLLQSIAIVATDASIKNDITTFILHTHTLNQPLIKMLHHAAFVTSAEAELFAIRCGINQASTKENISKIIVITNSIHVAKSFLIPRLIHFKFMLWLFSRNSVISFSEIQATQ